MIDRFIRSIPFFQELFSVQNERIKVLEAELFELMHSECDKCKILQGQLEYERDRTSHLLDLLSPTRPAGQKAVGKKSWNTLQSEMEQKSLKEVNGREE